MIVDDSGVFVTQRTEPRLALVEGRGLDRAAVHLAELHTQLEHDHSPATVERAKQCKFRYVYQGHIEKIPILEEILADAKLVGEQVAYIGDDLTDVVVMRRVGLAVATANARAEVKAQAHFVTAVPGGSGAVREVVEVILKAQGYWEEILRKYEVPDV